MVWVDRHPTAKELSQVLEGGVTVDLDRNLQGISKEQRAEKAEYALSHVVSADPKECIELCASTFSGPVEGV